MGDPVIRFWDIIKSVEVTNIESAREKAYPKY